MRRETWNDLAVFAAVGEAGSFSGAAKALGVSPSAISHTIRGLEARLQVRLLNRSTRSVAPTPAGQRLLAALGPAKIALDSALEALEGHRDRPAGRVRVSAHRTAATFALLPRLRRFGEKYPEVEVELVVDDRLVDVVGEGFDAGVRRAEVLQPDMISVRLDDGVRLAYVAAPEYLGLRGRPRAPQDLLAHSCANYRYLSSGRVHRWVFERGGERVEVDAPGRLIFNDVDLLLGAALEGCGIACVTADQARPHLASGRLEEVLADWAPRLPPNHLYYAGRRNVPPALRVFAEEMRAQGPSPARL